MAGNKKKKRPTVNPSRGFATQSIASKVKETNDDSTPDSTAPSDRVERVHGESATASPPVGSDAVAAAPVAPDARDLHELSPEELERRLEETEIQTLVENVGPKAHREATRQSSKLQTDCRVLRPQAQSLSTRLLPPEVLSQMLSLVQDQQTQDASRVPESVRRQKVSENDMLPNVWTLYRVLLAAGFREQQVERALRRCVRNVPMKDNGSYIWGLKESLEWLVLTLADDDLPVLDVTTGKPVDNTLNEQEIDEPLDEVESKPPHKGSHSNKQASSAGPEAKNAARSNADETKEQRVSDLEDDLDPQEMISVYLRTKARLYDLRPDLIDPPSKRSKGQSKPEPPSSATQSIVARLRNKLKKISFDLLFDQDEAERQWQEQRISIAKEQATRRKLQLSEVKDDHQKSSTKSAELKAEDQTSSRPSGTASTANDSDSESDTALGDLFAAEPIGTASEVNHTDADTTDPSVTIRDFGDAKGVDPRRVLEDACHSSLTWTVAVEPDRVQRDSAVKFTYKVISSAAFAVRHSLQISWSKRQSYDRPLDLSSVPTTFRPSKFTFSMKTVATPNRQQSQAYISVVALFQIFSASSKEDKAYLRLPSSWRDLYSELLQHQARHTEEIERATVSKLRDLIREVTNEIDDLADEDIVLTRNFRKRNEQNRSGSASPALTNGDSASPSDEQLKSLWTAKASSDSFRRMFNHRQQLPVFAFRDQALSTIEKYQVTIICGETGCGKSTQIPSYILEHELSQGRACKVYCTEPRRISAITLAQRVSEELGENKRDLGTPRSLVGYAIRLESRFTPSTRLVFATTGILLRMLESSEGTREITHLIIDEVHERSIETDFLLIILQNLRLQRPSLRIVLMSATVDATRFSAYFGGAPVLDVPGRTFPVENQFLEDAIESTGYSVGEDEQYVDETPDADLEDNDQGASNPDPSSTPSNRYSPKTLTTLSKLHASRIPYPLIAKLISFIISTRPQYARAILVFLPGLAEIRRLASLLSGHPSTAAYQIHALHSTISSEEQQAAFLAPSRNYAGKIVLSTNIAETGVTIPDITCVIDTGKHKEMRFDERRQISRLVEVFISRANAKQRRGRAGRVQEGLCYHLFSRDRHDRMMPEAQTPEILRLSLQDLIMRVKICKLGDIRTTLSSALDAPLLKNIERAIDALIEVGALNPDEELTPLGQELSKLPLDPYLGKLVLHGAQFSCLDAALTIASILTSKSPFVTTAEGGKATDNARQAFAKGDSDLLTEYNAYSAWRRICTTPNPALSEHQFCKRNMLSVPTLANIEDLKSQLFAALADAGCLPPAPKDHSSANGAPTAPASTTNRAGGNRRFLITPTHLNTHNSSTDLLTAVIAWSFHPKILARDHSAPKGGWRNIGTNQAVSIHPSSIYRLCSSSSGSGGGGGGGSGSGSGGKDRLLSFYSILQTSGGARNYNANSLTPVSPLLFLLLAGASSAASSSSYSSSSASSGLNSTVSATTSTATSTANNDALHFHPLLPLLTLDISSLKQRYILLSSSSTLHPPSSSAGPQPSEVNASIGPQKTTLILKHLRLALGEILHRRWRRRELGSRLEEWWGVWEGLVGGWEVREVGRRRGRWGGGVGGECEVVRRGG
ncbi:MAG: hypothetical protein M1828_003038 [Chrysothrix sp. TS-e1954]|nr:MAG: hypothetical protein M1828_003038 [Chrysothrix sp. TS-e1954]